MSWDDLRGALLKLERQDPPPLRSWPDPRASRGAVPARITLAPWAVDVAAQLDRRFGAEVSLTVGFLHFPSRTLLDFSGRELDPPQPSGDPVVDPASLAVTAMQPLEVRTGWELRSEVEVTNHRPSPVSISTNGSVYGRVVDPPTGQIVGGFAGAVAAPLVVFTADPGSAISVPLIVGTASYRGSLGYAIPPGTWSIEIVLQLPEGPRRPPLLPLRVVPQNGA